MRTISVGRSERARFRIADPALKREVEARRPAPDASVSRRVVFASWLESKRLMVEARRYWRELEAERPGNAELSRRAG